MGDSQLWDGLQVERGHPPFARVWASQVADYLSSKRDLSHLVIAHDAYDRETRGAHWLALNAAVGEALG